MVAATMPVYLPMEGPTSMLSASVSSDEQSVHNPQFQFAFSEPLTRQEIENVVETVRSSCLQSLTFIRVLHWFEHEDLALDVGNLVADAQQWFDAAKIPVTDMADQVNVEEFTQDMVNLNTYQRRRLLRNGSRVASRFPRVNIGRQNITVTAEFTLHVKEVISPQLTAVDQDTLTCQIVKDVETKYGKSVSFVRFGGIVLFGPEAVFHAIQSDLEKLKPVEIAGFTVDDISWGNHVSLSISGVPAQQILLGLHEKTQALQAQQED